MFKRKEEPIEEELLGHEEFEENIEEFEAYLEYRSHIRKIIGIILCAVLAISLTVGIYFLYRHQQEENAERMNEAYQYNLKLRPLYNEKVELEQRLAEIGEVKITPPKNMGSIILLCVEPGKWVIDDIKPVLESYGCVGVIAVSVDAFPGKEGYLSVQEFTDLLAENWSVCMAISSVGDIDKLSGMLSEIGVEKPDSVYIPNSLNIDSLDELKAYGINNAILHYVDNTEKVWTVTAKGCRENGTKSYLKTIVDTSGTVVFTMGVSKQREAYTPTTIPAMLESINEYVSTFSIRVTDIPSAYKRYVECEAQFSGEEKRLMNEKETIEKRLQEIDDEIMHSGKPTSE